MKSFVRIVSREFQGVTKFRRANFPDAVHFRSTTRKAETLKVHFEYSLSVDIYSNIALPRSVEYRLLEDNTAAFPKHVTTQDIRRVD